METFGISPRRTRYWPAHGPFRGFCHVHCDRSGNHGPRPPATDRIVQVGLVKFTADGTIVDEFAALVNSPGFDADARAVHGAEG